LEAPVDKNVEAEAIIGEVWAIATAARDGDDISEVELRIEELGRRIELAMGVRADT
jgi:hypothetical protein